MNSIKIYKQHTDIVGENERACGACALATSLRILGVNVDAQEIYDLGVQFDGLVPNIGWKHTTLCSLASRYGITAYPQAFIPYTEEGESIPTQGLEKIRQSETPTLVSIRKENSDSTHLVVVTDVEEGVTILDSDEGEDVKTLSIEEFMDRWTKRAIFFG